MKPLEFDASPETVRAYHEARTRFKCSLKARAMFEHLTSKPISEARDAWRAFLASVIPGKDESEFTGRDWRRVCNALHPKEIPTPDAKAAKAMADAERVFVRFTGGESHEAAATQWRELLTHTIPGKGASEFTAADWRKVIGVMRRILKRYPNGYPHEVRIDPAPYCVWFARINGMMAE